MRPQTRWLSLVSACGAVLLLGSVSPAPAQETHVGNLTGRAAAGKPLYTRYCAGCHGDEGDAQGENAQWIDPKPRDFTTGTFKCRSTPSGSLPTDQDLFNSVTRGFVTTNMPPWVALTAQNRVDVVSYIKTFASRWRTAKPGTPKAQLEAGGGTSNAEFAAIDPTTKQPVQNSARQVWISETALTSALNMSQLASQVSLFGIVVGIALLLSGIGFAIIAGAGALRNPETVLSFAKRSKVKKTPAVPVA